LQETRKSEMRSSKSETMQKRQCPKFKTSRNKAGFVCLGHSYFDHSNLFRVSIFEFRIYNLSDSWSPHYSQSSGIRLPELKYNLSAMILVKKAIFSSPAVLLHRCPGSVACNSLRQGCRRVYGWFSVDALFRVAPMPVPTVPLQPCPMNPS